MTLPIGKRVLLRWRALGIRQRLLVALTLPLVMLLLLSASLDYRLARKTTDDAFDHALADSIYDLQNHIRKQKGSARFELAEEAEAMLRSSAPDKLYFSIRDASGKLLAGDPDLPLDAATGRDGRIAYADAIFRDQAVRAAMLWVDLPGDGVGIVVMETTRRRQNASRHILTAMFMQNVAVMAVVLLAVLFGIRQGLAPLHELEHEIAGRSADDLHRIESAATPSELRPLVQRLNELFGLLQEASQAQQRFIGDAAHQLRTPLAGLQNQLDLAAGEGLFRDHPARLAGIEEATLRLGHLLTQLLAYAKAENPGASIGEPETVALDQVVEKSASEFIDAALAKEIDLGFEIRPAATSGHEWLLQEALANLIDNAIRYTPPRGVITVRSGQAEGRPFIEVEDSGPGIPAEHVQQVLERFYRIPGSPGNGCGLGLSIVSEIAKLHRGDLQLLPGIGGGLRVRLRF